MPLHERHGTNVPDRSVLIVAMEGWIDAGYAAATAMAALLASTTTEKVATFLADELVDHRARRPRLRIEDGVRQEVAFAEPELLVGRDRLGAGMLLLVGPEPDYRWRAFASEVATLATQLGVRLVAGLGAFPAGVPHTRPVRLASTASNAQLARSVGFLPGAIDVPAGIGEVVGEACTRAGIPSVGLWARVPHYVSAMPFPAAAVALLDGLGALTGLVVDTEDLRRSAEDARRRVDGLIAESSEHQEMVRQLELQADNGGGDVGEAGGLGETRLPSGDEIAAELERYLRGET